MDVVAPGKVVDMAGRACDDERRGDGRGTILPASTATGSLANNFPPPRLVFDLAITDRGQRSANGAQLVPRKQVCRHCPALVVEAPLAGLSGTEPLHAK